MAPQLVGQGLMVDNGEFTVCPREACVQRADPGKVSRKRSRLHHNDTVELDTPRSLRVPQGQKAAVLLPITLTFRSTPAC